MRVWGCKTWNFKGFEGLWFRVTVWDTGFVELSNAGYGEGCCP